MLGHYTTPPVHPSIPIACRCCQRKHARRGSRALTKRGPSQYSGSPEVQEVQEVRLVQRLGGTACAPPHCTYSVHLVPQKFGKFGKFGKFDPERGHGSRRDGQYHVSPASL